MRIDVGLIPDIIIAVSSLTAIFPAFAWPIMYHVKSRGAWRDTAVGRHTMSIGVVLASLYFSAIIRFFLPAEVLQMIVRPAISVACAIVVWQQFIVLSRVLRDPIPEELTVLPRSALMTQPEDPTSHTDGMSVEDYVNIEAGSCAQQDSAPAPASHAEGDDSNGTSRRSGHPTGGE